MHILPTHDALLEARVIIDCYIGASGIVGALSSSNSVTRGAKS